VRRLLVQAESKTTIIVAAIVIVEISARSNNKAEATIIEVEIEMIVVRMAIRSLEMVEDSGEIIGIIMVEEIKVRVKTKRLES
jgi:hypothetical protein